MSDHEDKDMTIDRLQDLLKLSMEENAILRANVRAMAEQLQAVNATVVDAGKAQSKAIERMAEAAEEYSTHRGDERDVTVRVVEEGTEYGSRGFQVSVEIPVYLIRTEDKGALDLLAKARAAVEDAARRRNDLHEHLKELVPRWRVAADAVARWLSERGARTTYGVDE